MDKIQNKSKGWTSRLHNNTAWHNLHYYVYLYPEHYFHVLSSKICLKHSKKITINNPCKVSCSQLALSLNFTLLLTPIGLVVFFTVIAWSFFLSGWSVMCTMGGVSIASESSTNTVNWSVLPIHIDKNRMEHQLKNQHSLW